MREIKFRAWHVGLNKMFSANEMARDQLTLLTTGKFINVCGSSTKLSKIYDDMIPEQFTGLFDKNGKEIYEGDIVKLSCLTEPIRGKGTYWKDLCIIVEYKNQSFYPNGLEQSKIIGNIHENQELINV